MSVNLNPPLLVTRSWFNLAARALICQFSSVGATTTDRSLTEPSHCFRQRRRNVKVAAALRCVASRRAALTFPSWKSAQNPSNSWQVERPPPFPISPAGRSIKVVYSAEERRREKKPGGFALARPKKRNSREGTRRREPEWLPGWSNRLIRKWINLSAVDKTFGKEFSLFTTRIRPV